MNAISIRLASRDDIAAIQRINEMGQPGVSQLTAGELEAVATGATHCWVAVDAEQTVVGYLIAYRESDAYDGEEFIWFQRRYHSFLYVDEIAVAEDMRGRGIGERLYQAAIGSARGLDALVCEVNLEPPNPGSLRFHTRLGFVEVGQMKTEDGRLVHLLRLPLAGVSDASRG